MKGAKIIGIDFDDVLVETNRAMLKWHNRVYGTSYKFEHIRSWDLSLVWRCSEAEACRRVDEFMDSAEHLATEHMDSSLKVLETLQEKEVHIITARRKEFESITLSLAERHIPLFINNFHFPNGSEVGGVPVKRPKSQICLELGVDVFIEDNLVYAEDIALVGIPVLLFDRPWNQTESLPSNVTRVYSWEEILRKLV